MAAQAIVQHILSQLPLRPSLGPLFVAIQGPQGSGKSYSTELAQKALTTQHHLRVASLSLDDLYLPHKKLRALASAHPQNVLWRGRGLPGTHDTSLATEILTRMRDGVPTELPRFDKSLHGGEGDRLPMDGTGPNIHPPLDVVIVEGWCMGFRSIPSDVLNKKWANNWADECTNLKLNTELFRKEDVKVVNQSLRGYDHLWDFFHTFIQLKPVSPEGSVSQYSLIYKWRLEQEHYMKARNGGRGMSDQEVKLFVDRYIPGYVFFGEGVTEATSSWAGNGCCICLNERREVVEVTTL
ncbi:P-loop containing nucleoside triphosphate hydrolase protein [Pluteus cervinus]|uniref:P-loop containing nucleoside triphosphate hydrolase protein n=1 Tax=Pluteus cervinus TaxID=181527 RepID=A0ACD3B7N1_9AGAR|nr:P-loop containing nucleoside triphosphate hydrolase protein [Pluteus cervinus]